MNRLLILAIFASSVYKLLCPALSFSFVTSAKEDLNGDSKMEQISIHGVENVHHNFVLKINEDSIRAKLFSVAMDGFTIIDMDTMDQYQEIAVHTSGPSSDDEYLIFGYNGELIKEMGRLSRWPKFSGNRIVIVEDWMGFWRKKEKYVLNQKTRALQLIPQDLYYVGIETAVRQSFPICRTREDSTIVANLEPGSKVIVLLCDPSPTHCKEVIFDEIDDYYCDWYFLKSETGIVGWARLKL
ncbi:MAG: hypothetical protein ACE5K2_01810, partial [Candidatus Zixiibacteriota bacterium]